MTFDVKKIGEARYAGRVREAALNQERADDKARLAELEDFVRRHRKAPPSREDSVELESPPAKPEAAAPAPPPAPSPQESPDKPKDHLDITV